MYRKLILFGICILFLIAMAKADYTIITNKMSLVTPDKILTINDIKEYGNHTKFIVEEINITGIEDDGLKRIEILENENLELKNRITKLEEMLNVTSSSVPYIPEELTFYTCEATGEKRECPGGLSKSNSEGIQTRCYNTLMLGWKTCNLGWKLT